jgi:hypothetical protein
MAPETIIPIVVDRHSRPITSAQAAVEMDMCETVDYYFALSPSIAVGAELTKQDDLIKVVQA